ncbi:hypothetical protein Pfo_007019 [Paulownia fortunei]|nr:hypothetical protein Pfo_007019 [Paulownia fortunei]
MELVDKAKNFVVDKAGNMKKPEASITDVDLKDVGLDGITYLAKVSVLNPYGVSIPICDITYTLKSVDRFCNFHFLRNDKTILEAGMKVPKSVLLSLMKDIGADWDIDYFLEISLVIDLPVVGNITIPLSHKGEMKLPTIKDMF